MLPIQSFIPILSQKPAQIVITMHQKPDADAMGSSLGLYHFLVGLGHQVQVVSPTNWAAFLQWMPGVDTVIDYEAKKVQAIEAVNQAEYIFCLDFNHFIRTKHLANHLAQAKAQKILIDHHQEPDEASFSYGISNTNKSSTSEMVYDFIVLVAGKQAININIATCLYAGTLTDTGGFRFPSTTASVHEMVAHFLSLGLQHSQIHDNLFDNFLENRLRFFGHAFLHRMDVMYEYNTVLMCISKYDLQKYEIKTGDTEGLVNWLFTIQGIRLAAIVIDRDEERKWSFRSKGDFDVNTFARTHFEGGGHKNAAGGRSSDSLSATKEKFIQVLQQYKQALQ